MVTYAACWSSNNVFIMGYVTFSLGCYMVCCSVASLAVGYIYSSCSHLYSFASYDRPYALKIMSDVEDVTPANTDFPSSDVLLPSLPKKPLPQSLEASVPIQSSESSSDIASAFSLFRDYFDKTLGALKRDIQDESCSNTDSVAKKLKEESKITFRFEGNHEETVSIQLRPCREGEVGVSCSREEKIRPC